MNRKYLQLSVLLVGSLLFLGPTAGAQSTDDLNRAAGALFEKGDFAAAARLLELVLKLEPSAKAHRNLALCYAKIADAEEKAILHMQAYLRARPDAKDRAFVEKMIADLDEQIARRGSFALIESEPDDTAVYLNDARSALGRTPVRTRLPLGHNVLRLEKKGFETVRRPVEVALRQQLRVAVALTPALRDGAIVVSADVDGAKVTIDGNPAALGRNRVNPGAHQVRVAKAGRKAWEAEIRVPPGGTTEVVARLPVVELAHPAVQRQLRTWRWVAVGLTTAAVGAAIIGYSRAFMDRSRADGLNGQSFPSQQEFLAAYNREQRSASRNTDFGRAATVGAAALGATTLVLFLLDRRHGAAEHKAPVGFAPLPGGGMATVKMGF